MVLFNSTCLQYDWMKLFVLSCNGSRRIFPQFIRHPALDKREWHYCERLYYLYRWNSHYVYSHFSIKICKFCLAEAFPMCSGTYIKESSVTTSCFTGKYDEIQSSGNRIYISNSEDFSPFAIKYLCFLEILVLTDKLMLINAIFSMTFASNYKLWV